MSAPILATKLHTPSPPPQIVYRPRLVEQVNAGLHRKLTLVSASAGFGKTTLVSEWVNQKAEDCKQRAESAVPSFKVAWLSLDEGDNDVARFLTYLIAALQTVEPTLGEGQFAALQSPQPPSPEFVLTILLNEITAVTNNPDHKLILVLDDYHVMHTPAIDNALTFLLDHLPPQMHIVIATRENPPLPLARYRARGQLTELRATDLRFTPDEAAMFLNQAMALNLSSENITALETRTEGWIAGLQLAALSMQRHEDASNFIESFTGSHRFVLDYLIEEVLHHQSKNIQTFLLQTAILDRLCGPLCDAVLVNSPVSGQETLEYLEHTNLFIIPLDNDRQWYRYHHLFGDLLRQRLSLQEDVQIEDLHKRASQWYEENGLELEAFHHATAANDIDRAARLIEGNGMPFQYRGVTTPIIKWLSSLPTAVLDANPALWVTYASALTITGQPISDVEEKLQAAETILQNAEPDDRTRDQLGHIAALRALLGIPYNQVDIMLTQSKRALELLHPENLPVRTMTNMTLGLALQIQGDRAAAIKAYEQVIPIGETSGNIMSALAATTGLGQIQVMENRLYLAAKNYQLGLQLAGEPPPLGTCETYLGLANIYYQWNDLDTAQKHGEQGLQLALQMETVDTPALCEVVLARVKLAHGDVVGAATQLARAERFMDHRNFVERMPEVVTAQVEVFIHQGKLTAAAHLADKYELPRCQARVQLAQGNPAAALGILETYRHQIEAQNRPEEQLKAMVLQAVACQANGETEKATQLLGDTLTLAESGGFIRLFVDEGPPMAELLTKLKHENRKQKTDCKKQKEYINQLVTAFDQLDPFQHSPPIAQPLMDPLSPRELEVLQLVSEGLSNREISEQLFLALDTIKGHNRRIYAKLQVQRRTEAVARARKLGLL